LRRYIARHSCAMVPRWRIFGDCLGPAFPASRAQHISDLHSKFALGHTMCRSMVYIQCATAEIRRGKEIERKIERNHMAKLECGPMPNVMVALPNIGGALCSTPQSLADAHYYTVSQKNVPLPPLQLVIIFTYTVRLRQFLAQMLPRK